MKSYFMRVIFISVVGMFFTGIYYTNLGIISQFASQNGNFWVGPVSTSLIFLSSGIAGLYNKYLNKLNYRYVILIGAFGWIIFISFSVMFLFVGFSSTIILIILVGSFICGFIISPYYNGINNYVNQCGKKDNKTAVYFGINSGFNQSSIFLGNTISFFLIEPLGQIKYSFTMLGLSVVIALIFLYVKQFPSNEQSLIVSQNKQQSGQISQNGQTKLPLLMFFVFGMSGVMISFVFNQFSLSYFQYFSELPTLQLNKLTFSTLMFQGCGQFIGGITVAVFPSLFKKLVNSYIINGFLFIYSVAIIYLGFYLQQNWIIKTGAFFLGVCDCLCMALAVNISGRWNKNGISWYVLSMSTMVSIFTILNVFLSLPILIAVYLIFQLISVAILVKYREKINNEEDHRGIKNDQNNQNSQLDKQSDFIK